MLIDPLTKHVPHTVDVVRAVHITFEGVYANRNIMANVLTMVLES